MNNLKHLKVGDLVYTIQRYTNKMAIYKIERQTEKFHFIKINNYEIKIEKNTGYEYGSKSSGRYGDFDKTYYYEVTPEIILKKNIQTIKSNIKNLSNIEFEINENNYIEIKEALKIIYKYKII